jgi:branched-chain amino acid transport system substrate-binding protein
VTAHHCRAAAVAVAAILVSGACGSRLGEQRLQASLGLLPGTIVAGHLAAAEESRQSATGAATPAAPSDPGTGGSPSGVQDPARRQKASSGSPGVPGPAASSGRPNSPAAGGSNRSAGPGATGAAAGGPGPGAPPAAQPGGAVPPKGSGADIVFGSFGVQTGVLGAITRPAPAGVRAWAASLNSRGGLNGHRVRIVVGDDGGEPGRTQVVVRRMVEQDHVVAFLNHFSFTLYAALPYLESRGVPVIGGTNSSEAEDRSAVVFQPLLGADDGIAWSFLLAVAAQTPKKKIALVYCREVTQCEHQRGGIKSKLPYAGLEFVYEAQVSLAQPDYTAEMLGAQRAGAEVVMGLIDTASLIRLARSAHRQGYHPLFTGPHNLESDQTMSGGEEIEGLLVPSRLPPYTTSPKLADYRRAMADYQPGEPLGGFGSGGFVVGKLLEKLAPVIAEPVSSETLVAALYTLRGETLGGLLPGITFPRTPDRSQVNLCIVPTVIRAGTFVAHDPAESFACAPGWKPEN